MEVWIFPDAIKTGERLEVLYVDVLEQIGEGDRAPLLGLYLDGCGRIGPVEFVGCEGDGLTVGVGRALWDCAKRDQIERLWPRHELDEESTIVQKLNGPIGLEGWAIFGRDRDSVWEFSGRLEIGNEVANDVVHPREGALIVIAVKLSQCQ